MLLWRSLLAALKKKIRKGSDLRIRRNFWKDFEKDFVQVKCVITLIPICALLILG